MRVVFMGTPDFAEASLRRLIADGFEICAVYTQPDKAKGRGMELSVSPVKACALEHGIPVIQPTTFRDEQVVDQLRAFSADIIAVVAYGKILPDTVLASARLGAVNLHGSILPKYRGAAPIQWAVLNGDRETGVTTFHLVADMDAGDIIYTEKTEIGEFETSGELYDRLKVIGAGLLSRTLRDLDSGTAPRTPQNPEEATYVTRLDKSMSPIDWTKSAREIVKWIYGLQPWSSAEPPSRSSLPRTATEPLTVTTAIQRGKCCLQANRGSRSPAVTDIVYLLTNCRRPGKSACPPPTICAATRSTHEITGGSPLPKRDLFRIAGRFPG